MREKMTLKTHTWGVILTTAWPLVIALLVIGVPTFFLAPAQLAWMVNIVMLLIVLATLAICVPMYRGTYLFLPPTEYKGARLLARLGRHESETEVSSVSRGEIIVKQNFIEKAFKCCHIRMKGTSIYYRGVPEVEQVKAWINANFPEKTAAMLYAESRGKGKKKK